MSIYDLQSGRKYVCNLCGDERESESLPEWWLEVKNRRTETLQHLCELHMHTPESYKRQVADYSQAPGFKPPNARESCGHFVELKEVEA